MIQQVAQFGGDVIRGIAGQGFASQPPRLVKLSAVERHPPGAAVQHRVGRLNGFRQLGDGGHFQFLGLLKEGYASGAEDPLGDWEDRLDKVIAARRAGQEMGKVEYPVHTKSRKVGL